ncbi:MAG: hypothetical protein HQL12_00685 [Candidatus Omnitrophica bacterium]|nr:hypothetical protein [Candidatus Omnitrophota bacterium]
MNCFDKKGFTLIEILLSTVLVVLGVVGVVNAVSSGLYADKSVEGQSVALNLAQEQMEAVKNTAYANINTTTFPTGLAPLTGAFSNYSRQVILYTVTTWSPYVTTVYTGAGTNTNPVTVATVYVSWALGLVQNSVSLTTLLVQPS